MCGGWLCETEVIQTNPFENLTKEETPFIRKKSLRTAERKTLLSEESIQCKIEEEQYEQDWEGQEMTKGVYKKLIRLIEDHVILLFGFV